MPKHAPECSVIIPVYNKWELTRDCLASLHEHGAAHDLEVIVVDNASSDATASELVPFGESLFGERFTPIIFPENRNFGPACNAGARAATAPLLFFLNNDTILTPGWFPPLRDALRENDSLGAVGPLLLFGDGSVQHLGVTFGAIGPCHLYKHFPADHPVVAKKRDLQCLTGAAFMIRPDLFADCGGFYEGYRNGCEDLELCVHVRRRGKKLRCVADAKIFHLESQTPGRKDKDGEDHNFSLFMERCGGDVYTDAHHHALRDGFSVFINDFLDISFRLQEKDEQALAAEAAGRDEAYWLHVCGKHPLWVKGREILAHGMEQAGKQALAIRFLAELADIEPMRNRYHDLLRLVPFAEKDASWPKTAEERLHIMARFFDSKAYVLSRIQKYRDRFRPGGDPFLEQAFDAKLQEMFPARR